MYFHGIVVEGIPGLGASEWCGQYISESQGLKFGGFHLPTVLVFLVGKGQRFDGIQEGNQCE